MGTTINPSWAVVSLQTSPNVDSISFAPIPIAGGYNIFDSSSSLTKTFSTNASNYWISLRFYLYTIGEIDANLSVEINTNQVYSVPIQYANGIDYLINKAYQGLILANYYIYFNMTYYSLATTTVSISLPTNNASNVYYWGLNNFVFHLELCHYECRNCSGMFINNCTSCYDNATLNASGYCNCNENLTITPYPVTIYWLSYPGSACVVPIPYCLKYVRTTNYGCSLCKSPGYYLGNNSCFECDPLCAACENSTFCTGCQINYYLSGSSCLMQCPAGTLAHGSICEPCDLNCLSCENNPSNCTSCNSSLVLEVNMCQTQCSPGMWSNSAVNYVCHLCDQMCSTCNGAATQCTSCGNGLLLENMNCQKICSGGYFSYIYSNVCNHCDSSCLSCDSLPGNCTACKQNTYLSQNSCNSTCGQGYWASDSDNTCQKCHISCSTCTGGPYSCNCLTCAQGFLKQESACVAYCSEGYYFNENNNGECSECDSSCSSCDSNPWNCTSCSSGNILSSNNICLNACANNQYFDYYQTKCLNIYNTTVGLYQNHSDTNGYSLIFMNFSQNFIQKIQQQPNSSFSFNITNFSNIDYSYNFTEITSGIFQFSFLFHKQINSLNTLHVYFNLSFLSSPDTFFNTTFLEISLINTVNLINPSLQKTSDPTKLTLSFSGSFPVLFSMLQNVSIVSISNFDMTNYIFSIENTANPLIFSFSLSYQNSLIGGHQLELSFNLPFEIFDVDPNQLTITKLTISLDNYYILDSDDSSSLQTTTNMVSQSSNPSSASISFFSFLNSGSSLIFSGLLLLKSINFLKFLNINYPPNVLAIFDTEIKFSFFIFILPDYEFHHEDDPCDGKFDFYNEDNYVLNNLGNSFLEKMIILIIALLINFIKNHYQVRMSKFKLLDWVVNRGYEIFCWNFLLANLLSFVNDFFFYSLLNLAFPTPEDKLGLINVIISFVNIFVVILFMIFLYRKISNLHQILMEKKLKDDTEKLNNSSSPEKKTNKMNHSILVKEKENDGSVVEEYENSLRMLNVSEDKIQNINNISAIFQTLRKKLSLFQTPSTIKTNKILPFAEIKSKGKSVAFNDETKFNKLNNSMKGHESKSNQNEHEILENETPIEVSEKNFSEKQLKSNVFTFSNEKKTANPCNTIRPSENQESILEKYKILYDDFKEESNISYLYFFLDIMKLPLISIIIVFDRYHPFRQSICISLITFALFIFLLIIKPFKSKYLFIMNILNQICLLFCEISTCVLAFYDYTSDNDQNKRFEVGKIIVFGDLALIYLISSVMACYSTYSTGKWLRQSFHFLKEKVKERAKRNMVIPFDDSQHMN